MKNRGIKTTLLMAVLLLVVTGADSLAQRGRGMDRRGGFEQVCPNIPNLTEEQRSEILDLRTSHLSEMQSYRDQIDNNRTRYRALMRADRTDMGAINSNIDERAQIRSQMQKKQAQHHQAIRSLLNEEQKVWFDSAPQGGAGFGRRESPGRGAGFRQGAPAVRGRGAVCPVGAAGFGRGF